MSPDSSFSPSSSSVGAKATSVLMVAPSSSMSPSAVSSLSHRPLPSMPAPSASMMAPLNLQKFERPQGLNEHHHSHHPQYTHHSRPTAIATAVIRVQVPECNSSELIPRHAPSQSPTAMVSVSTNSGSGSHSPFMVPPPAAMYSNVIVMNKKPKMQQIDSSGPGSPDFAKSYPVMEPTVASSSGSNHGKAEPELNIGMVH